MAETALKEMKLELDGMPCKFQSCYQLPADRAERYCRACPGLTANNAWAVTCEWSGEVIETIVKVEGSKQEHVFVEDPIMMSEVQIPGLVEAQFTEGGAWVLGSAGMESLQAKRTCCGGSTNSKCLNFHLVAWLPLAGCYNRVLSFASLTGDQVESEEDFLFVWLMRSARTGRL